MSYLQGSLFEEDYLVRTLGNIANSPDTALTELVANAWDAGASYVSITIPEETFSEITVQDDGTGLTSEEFRIRWMTLGYNRIRHQSSIVSFPKGNSSSYRKAFGRNGVGRHGMLCFSDEYTVETTPENGVGSRFVVSVASGQHPFTIVKEENIQASTHGTVLKARVERNLPDPQVVRELISARFMHDPKFQVKVNGQSIELMQHKGLVESKIVQVNEQVSLEIVVIDSSKIAKTARNHGIAFWVGGRLVGEPGWVLGDYSIDGRTTFAKRHTIVVKTEDLFDHIQPDWSDFKKSALMDEVFKTVQKNVNFIYKKSMTEKVGETRRTVLKQHREELATLAPLGQWELSEFVERVTEEVPTISQDHLSAAVEAVIRLEKSRSGASLIQKLSTLSEEDIDGLNRLLDDWSVKDALVVLDEIDRRLLVIQAIEKFSQDPATDELKTLHPMVLQARWLFGPEFDSPHYTSNVSLNTAMKKLFNKKMSKDVFYNGRNRPDVIVLEYSALSAVCSEEFDDDNALATMKRILIIELKRGGHLIGRDEMDQANHYVEDLLNSGHLSGTPFINAFVVGHELDAKISKTKGRSIGDSHQPQGRVEPTTFFQLVSTANRRLFRLKEQLSGRYEQYTDSTLVKKVLDEPYEEKLF